MPLPRIAALLCGLLLLAGCGREPDPTWSRLERTDELPDELRETIAEFVDERCGTWSSPKLLGSDDVDVEQLRRGRDLYVQHCQQCHGVSGDGAGPAADILRPRPRDYRKGIFKFASTPQGSKPRRDDLVGTLRRGVVGTAMPDFALLPDEDIDALVDYVLVLTYRGELENRLIFYAEQAVGIEFFEEEPEDAAEEFAALTERVVDDVLDPWREAEGLRVYPETAAPVLTREHVERGRALFDSVGCVKCHGADGRGLVAGNEFTDGWGDRARAADLTSGMLHGGAAPLDVYRRIHAGIAGTPMISALNAVPQDRRAEAMWDLVAYVLYVSNRRRASVIAEDGGPIPPAVAIPAAGESVLEATYESDEDADSDTPDEDE